MARYLVVVNNNILTHGQRPVYEVHTSHGVHYATDRERNVDLTQFVEEELMKIRAMEDESPMNRFLTEYDTIPTTNTVFSLKIYYTPLFRTMVKLIKEHLPDEYGSYKPLYLAGSSEDFLSYFLKVKDNFILEQFDAVASLMPHIEKRISIHRSGGINEVSPFLTSFKYKKMMCILYADILGMVHPLSLIPQLHSTRLLAPIYDKGSEVIPETLEEPYIFNKPIKNNSINVYMATSSDILKLLNLDEKAELSSAAILRLIGGIAVSALSPIPSGEFSSTALMMPVSYEMYRLGYEERPSSDDIYFVGTSAQALAEAEKLPSVEAYNFSPIAQFVSKYFPQYQGRALSASSPIVAAIKGGARIV